MKKYKLQQYCEWCNRESLVQFESFFFYRCVYCLASYKAGLYEQEWEFTEKLITNNITPADIIGDNEYIKDYVRKQDV